MAGYSNGDFKRDGILFARFFVRWYNHKGGTQLKASA